MVDSVGLGKFLFLERISHAYTQAFVADITNISERTLRYIENGSVIPELNTYWTLCDLYGVPPEMGFAFYRRSPDMEHSMKILKKEMISMN